MEGISHLGTIIDESQGENYNPHHSFLQIGFKAYIGAQRFQLPIFSRIFKTHGSTYFPLYHI
jgi:hypothetical protein